LDKKPYLFSKTLVFSIVICFMLISPSAFAITKEKINHPPEAPEVSIDKGEITGMWDLIIRSTDPDGDDVFYYIDLGDGTFIYWIGPYGSGVNVTIEHVWPPITKLYEGKAMGKDIYGAESPWTHFFIFIIGARAIVNTRYHLLFGRF